MWFIYDTDADMKYTRRSAHNRLTTQTQHTFTLIILLEQGTEKKTNLIIAVLAPKSYQSCNSHTTTHCTHTHSHTHTSERHQAPSRYKFSSIHQQPISVESVVSITSSVVEHRCVSHFDASAHRFLLKKSVACFCHSANHIIDDINSIGKIINTTPSLRWHYWTVARCAWYFSGFWYTPLARIAAGTMCTPYPSNVPHTKVRAMWWKYHHKGNKGKMAIIDSNACVPSMTLRSIRFLSLLSALNPKHYSRWSENVFFRLHTRLAQFLNYQSPIILIILLIYFGRFYILVLSVLGLFFYAVAYRRIHTIILPVVAEYDAMHPQLQFHQQSMQQQQEGNRWKRGVMPTVKFNAPDIERDGDFWNNAAQDILKKQLQKNTLNKNVAKNIILFLGDGMSIPTLAATRIYMGGEDRELSFEKFPYNGMSKVKCR